MTSNFLSTSRSAITNAFNGVFPPGPSSSTGAEVIGHRDSESSVAGEDNPLKRELGVWDLTSIGVGGIIGAGIYVLTGQAAALYAGPAVVLSFCFSGLACTFSALCYAELASMIPVAGSAYSFTTATLGQATGWIIGWDLMLEYLFGAAAVAVGWSGYTVSLLKEGGLVFPKSISEAPVAYDATTEEMRATDGIINLPAVFVCIAMTAVQIYGIRESAKFNTVIVGIKIVVLLLFIFVGFAYINTDNWKPFVPENQAPGVYGFSGILRGSAVVFFAYIGFDAISTATQEAKNPQVTVPAATLISLAVCTILYIVVGMVLTGIVSYKELNVPDPIAVALDAAGGDELRWLRPMVKIGAIMGLTSVVMVQILGQARIFYAMADDGLLPPIFATVHPKYKTPYVTTVVTGAAASIVAGLLPIDILGEMVSIGTLFAFTLVCAGVLVLRRTQPQLKRPFRTPWVPVVPLLGIITALAQMAALPGGTWLRLFIWMAIGALIYWFYGRKHAKPHAVRQAKLLGLRLPSSAQASGAGGLPMALVSSSSGAASGGIVAETPGPDGEWGSGGVAIIDAVTGLQSPTPASRGAGSAGMAGRDSLAGATDLMTQLNITRQSAAAAKAGTGVVAVASPLANVSAAQSADPSASTRLARVQTAMSTPAGAAVSATTTLPTAPAVVQPSPMSPFAVLHARSAPGAS